MAAAVVTEGEVVIGGEVDIHPLQGMEVGDIEVGPEGAMAATEEVAGIIEIMV